MDEEVVTQLDALKARVDALESANAVLREELERVRAAPKITMRSAGRCPSCGGGSLFHVKRILESTPDETKPQPLSLSWLAGVLSEKRHGPLELFVCRSCLLVEWRVGNLDDVTADGEAIVEIETKAEAFPMPAPYR